MSNIPPATDSKETLMNVSANSNPSQQPPPYPNEPPPKYELPNTATFTPDQTQQLGFSAQPVFIMHHMNFGPLPQEMECPYCHAFVRTSTQYRIGTMTWLVSGVLCFFGCWCGCCLIPFCIGSMKDVAHYCPNCNRIVGTHRRFN